LKDSTCRDFEDYTGWKINSHRNIDLPNGSRIMFRHIEELNNIQNINLGWFLIEQMSELETDEEFFTLWGRLRRKNVGKTSGGGVANTKGHNWVYKLWKLGNLERSELSEATTFDNKENLDEEFIETIEQLKEHKPKLYKRLVMNSWDESDIDDVMIKRSDVENAYTLAREEEIILSFLSVDPARYGDDESVIGYFENMDLKNIDVYRKKRVPDLATIIHVKALKKKCDGVILDAVALPGVADTVEDLSDGKYDVVRIIGSERKASGVPPEYYNRRSQIYWECGQKLANNEIPLSLRDEKMVEQLCSLKYEYRSGGIKAQTKKEYKKVLGCSPDRADMYVNGIFGADQITRKKKKKDAWAKGWKEEKTSAMAV
ncbi:MAG: phage terminase large subunit, partial [Elusimicrobiota bacterium]|nr:phage terminase large subunit [Elusimicrobiota bacterium]